MARWPTVHKERRAGMLDELRRRQTREQASGTPADRIRRADQLLDLVRALRPQGSLQEIASDESAEHWLALKQRLRQSAQG